MIGASRRVLLPPAAQARRKQVFGAASATVAVGRSLRDNDDTVPSAGQRQSSSSASPILAALLRRCRADPDAVMAGAAAAALASAPSLENNPRSETHTSSGSGTTTTTSKLDPASASRLSVFADAVRLHTLYLHSNFSAALQPLARLQASLLPVYERRRIVQLCWGVDGLVGTAASLLHAALVSMPSAPPKQRSKRRGEANRTTTAIPRSSPASDEPKVADSAAKFVVDLLCVEGDVVGTAHCRLAALHVVHFVALQHGSEAFGGGFGAPQHPDAMAAEVLWALEERLLLEIAAFSATVVSTRLRSRGPSAVASLCRNVLDLTVGATQDSLCTGTRDADGNQARGGKQEAKQILQERNRIRLQVATDFIQAVKRGFCEESQGVASVAHALRWMDVVAEMFPSYLWAVEQFTSIVGTKRDADNINSTERRSHVEDTGEGDVLTLFRQAVEDALCVIVGVEEPTSAIKRLATEELEAFCEQMQAHLDGGGGAPPSSPAQQQQQKISSLDAATSSTNVLHTLSRGHQRALDLLLPPQESVHPSGGAGTRRSLFAKHGAPSSARLAHGIGGGLRTSPAEDDPRSLVDTPPRLALLQELVKLVETLSAAAGGEPQTDGGGVGRFTRRARVQPLAATTGGDVHTAAATATLAGSNGCMTAFWRPATAYHRELRAAWMALSVKEVEPNLVAMAQIVDRAWRLIDSQQAAHQLLVESDGTHVTAEKASLPRLMGLTTQLESLTLQLIVATKSWHDLLDTTSDVAAKAALRRSVLCASQTMLGYEHASAAAAWNYSRPLSRVVMAALRRNGSSPSSSPTRTESSVEAMTNMFTWMWYLGDEGCIAAMPTAGLSSGIPPHSSLLPALIAQQAVHFLPPPLTLPPRSQSQRWTADMKSAPTEAIANYFAVFLNACQRELSTASERECAKFWARYLHLLDALIDAAAPLPSSKRLERPEGELVADATVTSTTHITRRAHDLPLLEGLCTSDVLLACRQLARTLPPAFVQERWGPMVDTLRSAWCRLALMALRELFRRMERRGGVRCVLSSPAASVATSDSADSTTRIDRQGHLDGSVLAMDELQQWGLVMLRMLYLLRPLRPIGSPTGFADDEEPRAANRASFDRAPSLSSATKKLSTTRGKSTSARDQWISASPEVALVAKVATRILAWPHMKDSARADAISLSSSILKLLDQSTSSSLLGDATTATAASAAQDSFAAFEHVCRDVRRVVQRRSALVERVEALVHRYAARRRQVTLLHLRSQRIARLIDSRDAAVLSPPPEGADGTTTTTTRLATVSPFFSMVCHSCRWDVVPLRYDLSLVAEVDHDAKSNHNGRGGSALALRRGNISSGQSGAAAASSNTADSSSVTTASVSTTSASTFSDPAALLLDELPLAFPREPHDNTLANYAIDVARSIAGMNAGRATNLNVPDTDIEWTTVFAWYFLLTVKESSSWKTVYRFSSVDRLFTSRFPGEQHLHLGTYAARVRTIVAMFSQLRSESVTQLHKFPEALQYLSRLLCPSRVNLLGGHGGSRQHATHSVSHQHLSATTRYVSVLFAALRRAVLQVATMERELEAKYVTSITAAAATPGEGEGDDEKERGGSENEQTTTAAAALPSTRHLLSLSPGSASSLYVEDVRLYWLSLVSVVDVLVDSYRVHAAQKTLDAATISFLNRGISASSQRIHRLLRSSKSITSREVQLRMAPRSDVDAEVGGGSSVDRFGVWCAAALLCFFSTLLVSDARHFYLDADVVASLHSAMNDLHAFIHGVVALVASAGSSPSTSAPRALPPLYAALVDMSQSVSHAVRVRMGFPDAATATTGFTAMGAIAVLDALSLTSTLARTSPTPALAVHELVQAVLREIPQLPKHELRGCAPAFLAFQAEQQQALQQLQRDYACALEEQSVIEKKTQRMLSLAAAADATTPLPTTTTTQEGEAAGSLVRATSALADTGSETDAITPSAVNAATSVSAKYIASKIQTLRSVVSLTFFADETLAAAITAAITLATPPKQLSSGALGGTAAVAVGEVGCGVEEEEANEAPLVGEDFDDDLAQDSNSHEAIFSPFSPRHNREQKDGVESRPREPSPSGLGDTQGGTVAAAAAADLQKVLQRRAQILDTIRQGSHLSKRRHAELYRILCRDTITLVRAYGVAALAAANATDFATCLGALRSEATETEELCEVVAESLRVSVNDAYERSASYGQHLRASCERQRQWMAERGETDVTAFAAVVAGGGLFPKETTRFQVDEDAPSVLEALSSRQEAAMQSYFSTVEGGSTTTAIAAAAQDASASVAVRANGKQRRRAIATQHVLDTYASQAASTDDDPLPVSPCVLYTLLREVRHLSFGSKGVSQLVHELRRHLSLSMLQRVDRVGPRSVVFEALRIFPQIPSKDELAWWHGKAGVRSLSIMPHGSASESDLVEWRVVRSAAILATLSSMMAIVLVTHRVGVDELLRYDRPDWTLQGGAVSVVAGGRRDRSLYERRRNAARERARRLCDPVYLREHPLEMFLLGSQQWMIKTAVFADSVAAHRAMDTTIDEADIIRAESEGTGAAGHVETIVDVAAGTLSDCCSRFVTVGVSRAIRKYAVVTLSAFLVSSRRLARVNVNDGTPGEGGGGGYGTRLDNNDARARGAQLRPAFALHCPTFYAAVGSPSNRQMLSILAEAGTSQYTASVASAFLAKIRREPPSMLPLSPMVNAFCSMVNLTVRRSELLSALAVTLMELIVHEDLLPAPVVVAAQDGSSRNRAQDLLSNSSTTTSLSLPNVGKRPSSSRKQKQDAVANMRERISSPAVITDEQLVLLVSTLAREDLQIPRHQLCAFMAFVFTKRRDLFGDPPFRRNAAPQLLLKTSASAVRGGGDECSGDAALLHASTRSSAVEAAQDPLAEAEDEGDWEGLRNLSLEAPLALQQRYSHRAALESLHFTVEQWMLFVVSYAFRSKLPMRERNEARSMIADAFHERHERVVRALSALPQSATVNNVAVEARTTSRTGSRSSSGTSESKSRSAFNVLPGSRGLQRDDTSSNNNNNSGSSSSGTQNIFEMKFRDPLHYGVLATHLAFAARKILHSSARRTGTVQAPHTLADMVELLHEVETDWKLHGKQDAMLQTTLKCLLEWALQRVDDAGCSGLEDRNQYVTGSDRMYGDVVLRLLANEERRRERRKLFAEREKKGRKWNVSPKIAAAKASSSSSL